MPKLKIIIITVFLFCATSVNAAVIHGSVIDTETGDALPYATITAMPGNHVVLSDTDGKYSISLPDGKYTISVSYVGYNGQSAKIDASTDSRHIFRLKPTAQLGEVVVTASESNGITSSSRIDRDAMEHLQPTSFTDLLELLPGGMSKTPAMGQANTISLRETGALSATGQSTTTSEDYAISSLGTLFMVDGAPINGDANLQSEGISSDSSSPNSARSIVNRGVDMRTLSTDNIESVEIVRGIPSAEYGNLTSGLVNIKRIRRPTPFTARFKADEYSKLFSAGKGFEFGEGRIINADISYLDSKIDPRNTLENYKRLTGSLRLNLRFKSPGAITQWVTGIDYTGSFDNSKADPDLNYNKIDEYKSSYNRTAFTSDLNINLTGSQIFNAFNVNTSLSYQNDRLERHKQVAPQRASIAPTTMNPGVNTGQYLLSEYIADYVSDGKPLNIFVKGRASGQRNIGSMMNNYKAGVEWTMSKNYGDGQVYDLTRPLSAGWTSRPRAYKDIPALHVLSFFIEENATVPIATSTLDMQLGLRTIQLPSLDKSYYLSNRPYLDPRINIAWHLPAINTSYAPIRFTLAGGFGLATKMPTIDYLYPQCHYNDIIQLNYYDVNDPANRSLVSLMTYIDDATNKDLRAARNRKWEVRLGMEWGGNRLSVTYFQEHMNDGFRYSSVYAPYSYNKYDASVIDPSTLTGQPSLDDIPYTETTILDGFRRATNGTRIDKQGIEFQLNTARWKALHTSLTISGAWFKTTYTNSQMLFSTVSDVVDNQAVSDLYVGLYDYNDGRVNEQFNTNFMFDTQIPQWGLIFSTSLQCVWWIKTTRMWQNGVPPYYLATDGQLHPFTEADASDPVLRTLIKTYNEDNYKTQKIPFAGYVNLKATKTIGKILKVAVFANKLLDWLPDYRSNGLLVRRSTDAYFGMELNVTI